MLAHVGQASQYRRTEASDSATKGDSRGKMTVGREFRVLGTARRIAWLFLEGKRREGGAGARCRRTPLPCRGHDGSWETQRTADREGLWEESGRDSGIDSRIDFRRHELGPEDPGSALADLRLEIQREKGLKEVAGQEGDQQETLDGVGLVLIDVVGMPAVDQFVEPVILDIPSLVAKADTSLGGGELDG